MNGLTLKRKKSATTMDGGNATSKVYGAAESARALGMSGLAHSQPFTGESSSGELFSHSASAEAQVSKRDLQVKLCELLSMATGRLE
jgi:hypothetical protein